MSTSRPPGAKCPRSNYPAQASRWFTAASSRCGCASDDAEKPSSARICSHRSNNTRYAKAAGTRGSLRRLRVRRDQSLSRPAIVTMRWAMWSSAAYSASVTGASLVAPVTWETPYGLPSANFSGSV